MENSRSTAFRFPLIIFLVLLFAPAVAIVKLAGSEEAIMRWALPYIAIWIPIVTILRMRAVGMAWKEILLACIPFWGLKYWSRIYKRDSAE